MKFAHMGDCHLGSWRQPELKDLNFRSFQYAISKCLFEKVDFILISGDLFDSAYPSIETLKETFSEFRRLKEANIPVFIIAGSHDYSVAGKTFLEVLEKAGLAISASKYEEKDGKIILSPIIYKNCAIYGFSGKKSSLEVDDIERIKIHDSPGLFKILMLHTAIRDAVRSLPIKAVDEKTLPAVDYVALSHLHIKYAKNNIIYSGPTFPNNISELEELKNGGFFIFENGQLSRIEIKIKDVVSFDIPVSNTLSATEDILSFLKTKNVSDKIVILKFFGVIEQGKISDIDFRKIEEFLKKEGAFVMLKSISKLHMADLEIKLDSTDSANIESQIIKNFEEKNPNKFNILINDLVRALQIEKLEDEKSLVFEERLLSETRKIIKL